MAKVSKFALWLIYLEFQFAIFELIYLANNFKQQEIAFCYMISVVIRILEYFLKEFHQ